jgi:hypothetical protein
MRYNKKKKSFIDLSRSKRCDKVIKIKNRIAKQAPIYGGLFSTDFICEQFSLGNEKESKNCAWFDCYCLSKRDKSIFYNVEIITSGLEYEDIVMELVYRSIDETLKAANIQIPSSLKEASTFFVTPLDIFDKRTYREQLQCLVKSFIEKDHIKVYESFKLDFTYRFGIGLYIVVDAESLTKDLINSSIKKFYDLGEIDWCSPKEVLISQKIKNAIL